MPSRPELEGLPTPSLIDRLSGDEATATSSIPIHIGGEEGSDSASRRRVSKSQYREAAREYKDSVKRDLEWLLNTRQVVDDRLEQYPNLSKSVYAYGLPDISSANMSSAHDQQELLRRMEEAIEVFDHRLKDIQISPDAPTGANRMVRFSISGIVLMDPAPEEITIDTVLDPSNGEYEVK